MEKYCRAEQDTDDSMTHVHCLLEPKATDTHLEYILFFAFPLQQLRFPYLVSFLVLLHLFLSN
jgi:hypothetical protein